MRHWKLLMLALLLAAVTASSQVGQQPGVTGPVFSGGSVALPLGAPTGCTPPGYGFTGVTNSGMCWDGVNTKITNGFSNTISIEPVDTIFTRPIYENTGVTTYSWLNDVNTGLQDPSPGSGSFNLMANGSLIAQVNTTQFLVGNVPVTNSHGNNGGWSKNLTESSATPVLRLDLNNNDYVGGFIEYCVRARDASDYQVRCSRVEITAVSKAGAVTCTIGATDETNDGSTFAASAGTLTYALTVDTGTSQKCIFKINAVSSLTQIVLEADVKFNSPIYASWTGL